MVVGTSGFWVTDYLPSFHLYECVCVCVHACVLEACGPSWESPPITPVTHPLYPLRCSLSVKPRHSFPSVGVASLLAPGVPCFSYLNLELQASCPTCSVGIQTPVFFIIRQALSPQATPEPLGTFCLVVEK